MATRQEREAFVTGHAGTTLWEISLVAGLPALLLLLLRLITATPGSAMQPVGATHRLEEFVVLVLPLLAALLGPPLPLHLAAALTSLACLLLCTHRRRQLSASAAQRQQLLLSPVAPLRAALTTYRASLLLLTTLAILAVDFPAFPRRFAKAETFGTGLMDAGVGGIVVAGGIASGFSSSAAAFDPAARRQSTRSGWARGLWLAAALAALGLGKAAFVAAADYQSHVGEYGRHWNFFLTLAVLRLLSLVLGPLLQGRPGRTAVLGGVVLAAHQAALSAGVIDYVHADVRGPELLAANKEGLLSLPGYWALQLLSLAGGHALFAVAAAAPARAQQSGDGAEGGSVTTRGGGGAQQRQQARQRRTVPSAWRAVVALGVATVACWAAYTLAAAVQPVSRRACNAAYVLWMLALDVQCLGLFAAADALAPGPPPHLLATLARHMLPAFLLANLLTGGVNMGMDTLHAGNWTARGVVGGYAATLLAGVAGLDAWLGAAA